jgi:hypothetical protein
MRATFFPGDRNYSLVHSWPLAPNIRLEGDEMRYDPFPADPKRWSYAPRPDARLLPTFTELADARDGEIESFARKWGCLALCRHGFTSAILYGFHSDADPSGKKLECCQATGREPLAFWRFYAGQFNAVLNLATGHGLASDWRVLGRKAGRPHGRNAGVELAHIANRAAADFGHLRPVVLQQKGGGLALRLAGSLEGAGLAAALAYQALVAVTQGNAPLVCAGCSAWFKPRKVRSPERAAYCVRCGRAAAERAASGRYYERNRDAVLKRQKERRHGAQTTQ